MRGVLDLLDRPTHTMAQVDRLLGLPAGTGRRWIDGYVRGGKDYRPIVRGEHTGDDRVTWGEFVEARLLAEFRSAGVPIVNMRPAISVLRGETGSPYPLAHSANLITPLGKELVMRAQDAVDLDRELRLVIPRNGQYVLSTPAEKYLRAVRCDENGDVVCIYPDLDSPEVVIDPLRASGEPILWDRWVPTEVVADQVRAGDPEETVAKLYELTSEQIRAAVRFEQTRPT